MPEDPIAHGELAALTRRHEQAQGQNVREFGIIKSELTTLQLKVSNLDQKVDSDCRAANVSASRSRGHC
ncbi:MULTISPECIES: hypothetical protein [Streptomyces]|uniref:hypothetical protein n=1 Tax=Streptomyces TaxID=1883 RepID=UPI00136C7998|nr:MULTISPECIES: hypothetical protein [Streptomyces]MCX5275062.1 hypothetical protein [Streptomyces virginiae]MYV74685.1 hypothetical protein [Streptomyces sp. SID1046]